MKSNEDVVLETLKVQEKIVVTEESHEPSALPLLSTETKDSESVPDLGPRYDVLEYVGSGGMGTVWKVHDKELNETFAIKVLKPELLSDETSVKRFQQEARLASDLTHANIAAIFGPGEDTSGRPFIIMRYVEGESLADILNREGKLDPERAMEIFWQIHAALVHSHMKGIIHRDIKPSNIIISRTESGGDRVNIIDFCIAKSIYEEVSKTQALTKAIDIFGSPQYMSPEQLLGKDVGPESDLYSLGCVLYEMLTGNQPFQGSNTVETILKQVNEFPDIANVPFKYSKVLGICLSKEPESRLFLEYLSKIQQAPMTEPLVFSSLYLKHLFALVPVWLMGTTLIFCDYSSPDLVFLLLITMCIIAANSTALLVFPAMQGKASKVSKEVAIASIFGATTALVMAITMCLLSRLTKGLDLQVAAFFLAGTSTAFLIQLISKLDISKLYDHLKKTHADRHVKDIPKTISMTATSLKAANAASLTITHVAAIATVLALLASIVFEVLPPLHFLFPLMVLTSCLNAITSNLRQSNKEWEKPFSFFIDFRRQLKLSAVYLLAAPIAAMVLIPFPYFQTEIYAFKIKHARNDVERANLYSSALALPHTAAGDLTRLYAATAEKKIEKDSEARLRLIEQVIENRNYVYTPLQAEALVHKSLQSKNMPPAERKEIYLRALALLSTQSKTSLTDPRELLFQSWQNSTQSILANIGEFAVQEGDEDLAKQVFDYSQTLNILDYRYKDYFQGLLDQARKNAQELPTTPGLPTAPTSPTPQQ